MEDRYLFKAKRTDNEEWVTGSLITCGDGTCKIATRYLDDSANIAILICAYDVDRDTICQSTGLKDKNGKLIWENDIVKISGHIYVCYWDEYNFEWGLKSKTETVGLGYIDKCIIEVIGNIFDNPELLEV